MVGVMELKKELDLNLSFFPLNYFQWPLLKSSNNNYAQLAKSMQVFLLGKKFQYLVTDPPASSDSKYDDRKAKDAKICSCFIFGIVWTLKSIVPKFF